MKLAKKILAASLALTMLVVTGCSAKKLDYKAETMENDVTIAAGDTVAVVDIKDFGLVKIKLLPEVAPKAVENFTTHAKNDYYDNLTFHRVVPGFVIQGGDPAGNGTGGSSIWGEPFEDEFSDTARNFSGALAMANSGPKTNGSQFFIVNGPPIEEADMAAMVEGYGLNLPEEVRAKYKEVGGAPHLDGKHTVFGMVYSGMDIIDKVMATPTEPDQSGGPLTKVVIKDIQTFTVK